jgi:hypothetical protein
MWACLLPVSALGKTSCTRHPSVSTKDSAVYLPAITRQGAQSVPHTSCALGAMSDCLRAVVTRRPPWRAWACLRTPEFCTKTCTHTSKVSLLAAVIHRSGSKLSSYVSWKTAPWFQGCKRWRRGAAALPRRPAALRSMLCKGWVAAPAPLPGAFCVAAGLCMMRPVCLHLRRRGRGRRQGGCAGPGGARGWVGTCLYASPRQGLVAHAGGRGASTWCCIGQLAAPAPRGRVGGAQQWPPHEQAGSEPACSCKDRCLSFPARPHVSGAATCPTI